MKHRLIFPHETIKLILSGHKTEMRVISRGGFTLSRKYGGHLGIKEVVGIDFEFEDERDYLEIGKVYSIGTLTRKRSHGRIRIRDLIREPLQNITEQSAIAEGIAPGESQSAREQFVRWWNTVHTDSGDQWADNPPVWRITFVREVKE